MQQCIAMYTKVCMRVVFFCFDCFRSVVFMRVCLCAWNKREEKKNIVNFRESIFIEKSAL